MFIATRVLSKVPLYRCAPTKTTITTVKGIAQIKHLSSTRSLGFQQTLLRLAKQNVVVPPLAESISEGDIKFEKSIGDIVTKGDLLASIETNKKSIPINSPVAGKIVEFLVEDSSIVKPGRNVMVIDTDGAGAVSSSPPTQKAETQAAPSPSPPPPTPSQSVSLPPPSPLLSELQGLLSGMKAASAAGRLYSEISKYGKSDMFNYATNERFDRDELKAQYLETWNRFLQHEFDNSSIRLPINGFEDLILLTEQGKLWKYPIDNEQGMEAEQQVPFEDHVFLDHHLEDFPKNENIQAFMGLVISGLAKNSWMTVDRKREIIKFYKEYFDERKGTYKEAGLEI